MALPITFMEFISSDVFMDILVFPMALNMAAPQLYMAKKGMAANTIKRYVLA